MAARLLFTLDPLSGNLIAITDPMAERPLSSLSDVSIPEQPTDKYVLAFIRSTGKWEARPMIEATFNKILTGDVVLVPASTTSKVYEYTLPAATEGTLMITNCFADGLGILHVSVNGMLIGSVENSYTSHDMQFIGRISLAAGDHIECFVENTSIEGATNGYTVWLYLREDPV